MEALEFLKTQKRMCKKYAEPYSCGKCPLNEYEFSVCNKQLSEINESETLEIVEQWAKEHPRKAYKQDFLEKFPNSYFKDCVPNTCRNILYGKNHGNCSKEYTCVDCWNEEMEV